MPWILSRVRACGSQIFDEYDSFCIKRKENLGQIETNGTSGSPYNYFHALSNFSNFKSQTFKENGMSQYVK